MNPESFRRRNRRVGNPERRSFALVTGLVLAVSLSGCARQEPLKFTPGEVLKDLPQLHQTQINQTMTRLFGTPSAPRYAIVPEQDEEEAEDADSAEGAVPTDDEMNKLLSRGARVYNVRCAGCHGISGDGDGEAAEYLHPKPRDYRRGIYKFTSTPFGIKPARADLVRTIRRGAKGTSMPAFPWMAKEDLDAVVQYVIFLSERGEVERSVAEVAGFDYDEDEELEPIEFQVSLRQVRQEWRDAESRVVRPVTAEPPMDAESIRKGRELFISENCWKCHGQDAKGQTEWLSIEFVTEQESLPEDQRIEINRDAWGQVAPAADLTARMLHGGRRPIDVYRRVHTGINGTPMPAFGAALAEDPDKMWHLVHYVLNIVEGGPVDPTATPEDAE